MELLAALREADPDTVAVVITAYASLDTAVEATKRGAYDYLAKPLPLTSSPPSSPARSRIGACWSRPASCAT